MIELVSTKLFIPRPRKNLVSRLRLVDRLNEGLEKKLTLIAAPAGFGKTTLLSEWIPQSPRCVTWLSLDEADNDPTRFWAYFIASLQSLSSQLGQNALALLQSTPSPPPTSTLAVLINDILAFQDTFAIVLDDYHLIDSQPIHESLTFLMDHLPANMHVVITTRVDPPLPVSRMRARGTLTELRASDLRFIVDEVNTFLSQAMGLNLSAEEVATLEARTEGWVAGLQIAALSMQGREDIPGFIKAFSGSHRHIIGYLADEVINRQPDEIQNFMLQTSILDRLCGRLCDAITGISDGQVMLETLEHANLFVEALDDRREWYRYHHLFAEVLRTRLHQTRPDLIPELHSRASLWYEQNGLREQSVNHALSARDFDRAVQLIEHIGIAATLRGEVHAVFNWLKMLPEAKVNASPKLSVLYAWLLLSFSDFENAGKHLESAEKALKSELLNGTSPESLNTRGELLATKAMHAVYLRGFDPSQLIDWAEQALRDLRSDNTPFRGTATGILATAYRNQRDWSRAEQAFAQAAAMERNSQNVMSEFAAIMQQTLIQRLRGALSLAIATSRRALDWAAERGAAASPFTGGVDSNLAGLLRERNEFEEAERFAHLGVTRCALTGNPHQHIASLLILARLKQAMGNFEGALESLLQARELARQNQAVWFLNLLPAVEVQFYLAQGNLSNALQRLPEAQAKADEWHDFVGGYELVFAYEIGQIAPVQVNIAHGRVNRDSSLLLQTIARLDEQINDRETAGLIWYRAKVLILQAIAYDGVGDSIQSLTCLEHALTLAEPEGYIRIFVDEGEPIYQLLLDFQTEIKKRIGNAVDDKSVRLLTYIDKLLATFTQSPPIESTKNNSLSEPLSERELDILRLIAAGRSNQEIAELLVIALSTVKSHINHIYGKLGTNRRAQAIAIARDLGLLAD
jgi:LuxR family maltose regulon positive regulatory protein